MPASTSEGAKAALEIVCHCPSEPVVVPDRAQCPSLMLSVRHLDPIREHWSRLTLVKFRSRPGHESDRDQLRRRRPAHRIAFSLYPVRGGATVQSGHALCSGLLFSLVSTLSLLKRRRAIDACHRDGAYVQ